MLYFAFEFTRGLSALIEVISNVRHLLGYYLGSTHPPEMDTMTQEELVQGMVHEVTVGADGTDYKCGVLGEIGCSTDLLRKDTSCLAMLHHNLLRSSTCIEFCGQRVHLWHAVLISYCPGSQD